MKLSFKFMYPMMCNQILLKIFILLLNIGYCWNGPKSHLRNLVSREIWALRNLVPSWTSFYGILILGPNFMGLEFLGTHISSRPNFLGTLFLKIQKSRAPVEIRKYVRQDCLNGTWGPTTVGGNLLFSLIGLLSRTFSKRRWKRIETIETSQKWWIA